MAKEAASDRPSRPHEIVVIPMTPFGDLGIALSALAPDTATADLQARRSVEIARLRAKAEEYREKSIAPSTRRVYASNLKAYTRWCERLGYAPINGDPQIVMLYVAHAGDRGLKPSSLDSHVAAIRKAHEWCNLPSPTADARIKNVLRGARRRWAAARADGEQIPRLGEDGEAILWSDPEESRAAPVTLALLRRMVTHCRAERIDPGTGAILIGEDGEPLPDWAGLRDAAILLLGFGMAARRSEVARLRIGDVTYDPRRRGIECRIRFSKTDQLGAGQAVAVAHAADPALDAPGAINRWLEARRRHGLPCGPGDPLFVRLKSNAWPDAAALTDESISDIVRKRVLNVAMSYHPGDAPFRHLVKRDYSDPVAPGRPILDEKGRVVLLDRWSGHSLRSGFLTEAAKLTTTSIASLKQQSRHSTLSSLSVYVRNRELWQDNASAAVFSSTVVSADEW